MIHEDLPNARFLDEELQEFIQDWLPEDTSKEIKIKMQSQAIESMIITKNIVMFVKWLGYPINFEVGESNFVPAGSPEMNKIQLIQHAHDFEVYIKDIH